MNEQYPAQFYHLGKNGIVNCELCPHNCKIAVNKTGICKVRKNIDGKLYSLNYSKVSSLGVDPVEKNPSIIFTQELKFYLLEVGVVIWPVHSVRTGR